MQGNFLMKTFPKFALYNSKLNDCHLSHSHQVPKSEAEISQLKKVGMLKYNQFGSMFA